MSDTTSLSERLLEHVKRGHELSSDEEFDYWLARAQGLMANAAAALVEREALQAEHAKWFDRANGYALELEQAEARVSALQRELETAMARPSSFVCDGCGEPVQVDAGLVTYHAACDTQNEDRERAEKAERELEAVKAEHAKWFDRANQYARELEEARASSYPHMCRDEHPPREI